MRVNLCATIIRQLVNCNYHNMINQFLYVLTFLKALKIDVYHPSSNPCMIQRCEDDCFVWHWSLLQQISQYFMLPKTLPNLNKVSSIVTKWFEDILERVEISTIHCLRKESQFWIRICEWTMLKQISSYQKTLETCWSQYSTYKLWNFSQCVHAKVRVEVVKYRLKMKSCRFMEQENYGYPNEVCKQCGDQHSSHTQFQPELCHICCWTQDLSSLWSPCSHKTLILLLLKYNTLALHLALNSSGANGSGSYQPFSLLLHSAIQLTATLHQQND